MCHKKNLAYVTKFNIYQRNINDYPLHKGLLDSGVSQLCRKGIKMKVNETQFVASQHFFYMVRSAIVPQRTSTKAKQRLWDNFTTKYNKMSIKGLFQGLSREGFLVCMGGVDIHTAFCVIPPIWREVAINMSNETARTLITRGDFRAYHVCQPLRPEVWRGGQCGGADSQISELSAQQVSGVLDTHKYIKRLGITCRDVFGKSLTSLTVRVSIHKPQIDFYFDWTGFGKKTILFSLKPLIASKNRLLTILSASISLKVSAPSASTNRRERIQMTPVS